MITPEMMRELQFEIVWLEQALRRGDADERTLAGFAEALAERRTLAEAWERRMSEGSVDPCGWCGLRIAPELRPSHCDRCKGG